METVDGKTTMFIEGYQVFQEDQTTNITVKQEPPDIETVKIQPSSYGLEPSSSDGPEHGSPQVTDSTNSKEQDLERERLIQDYSSRKKNELTVSAVVEDLVKKNDMLLTKLDASARKHTPRKPPYVPDLFRSIKEPKDPISPCITKDLRYSNTNETIVETNVDESNNPEFICAIGSRVHLTTTQGQKLQLDVKCYWCNFCNFKTGDMDLLMKHMIEHRFHCKYCSYESFSRASVILHCNKTHNEFKGLAGNLKFCSYLPHIIDRKKSEELDKDVRRKKEERLSNRRKSKGQENEELDEDNRRKRKIEEKEELDEDNERKRKREDNEELDEDIRRKTDKESDKDGEASGYEETELLSMEVDEVGESGEISSALKDKIIIPSSVKKNLPPPETAPETAPEIAPETAPETTPTVNETQPALSLSSSLTEETGPVVSSFPAASSQIKDPSLPVISSVVSGEKAVAQAEKIDESRSKQTNSSGTTTETVSVTSGLCWSCGYCEFITLSQALLKVHLNGSHLGKPHKYVALLARSKEEMEKIRQADSKFSISFQKESNSSSKTEYRKILPKVSNIIDAPSTNRSGDNVIVPKVSNTVDTPSTNSSKENAMVPKFSNIVATLSTNSSRGNHIVPKFSNTIDTPSTDSSRGVVTVPRITNLVDIPSTDSSRDNVTVPKVSNIVDIDTPSTNSTRDNDKVPNIVDTPSTDSSRDNVKGTGTIQGSSAANSEDETEEEKKMPLFYKCAHCNYGSEAVERVKAHITLRHLGSVMYILDMKAVKFHKRRYLFFCLKNMCSFKTKEKQEYLEHVEKCIPTSSVPDIDSSTLKSMILTKQFIEKTFGPTNLNNMKSSKAAEYGCLYCSYVSENNTRVKKHVLHNHKPMPTKIKILNNPKHNATQTVTFCYHCLWETGEEKELGTHLAENHDDTSLLHQENVKENSEDSDISPADVSDKQGLETSMHTENLKNTLSDQSRSGQSSVVHDENISDCVEEQRYIEMIGKTEYSKALADYIASVEINDKKGKARPTRNAAKKSQIKTKLLKPPTLFKCYHCQDHLAFGVKLMKNHIEKEHKSLPMITYNLLKLEQNRMQALVYICPQVKCLYTAAFATDVITHARKNHGLQPTSPGLVLLSSITPSTSLNSSTRTRRATAATGESYECLYCTVSSMIYHSRRDMKKHLLTEHPQEEFLYRDCIARKLRQQSRYYMCHEMTCDFTCASSKDYNLHLLAHKKSTIYECSKCTWFSADEAAVKTHIVDEHNGENISTVRMDLDFNSKGQVVRLVNGTVIKSEMD